MTLKISEWRKLHKAEGVEWLWWVVSWGVWRQVLWRVWHKDNIGSYCGGEQRLCVCLHYLCRQEKRCRGLVRGCCCWVMLPWVSTTEVPAGKAAHSQVDDAAHESWCKNFKAWFYNYSRCKVHVYNFYFLGCQVWRKIVNKEENWCFITMCTM